MRDLTLADTSIWVEHLRRGNARLRALLEDGSVACHHFIIGELACGNLHNRDEFLSLLRDLPSVPLIEPEEFFRFLDHEKLSGIGLGFVDVHLLASARLANARLWTNDRILAETAARLGLA